MTYTHPFSPIIDGNTQVLFLGSFPSIASFEQAFYYAHPRNTFWQIFEANFDVQLETNDIKKMFCLEKGIGLWDVIESCERRNSSDTNLKHCIPNDFKQLLKTYPNIKAIAFTGKKAQELFQKYFSDLNIEQLILPSTSPAYAAMSREEKRNIYQVFLAQYLTV